MGAESNPYLGLWYLCKPQKNVVCLLGSEYNSKNLSEVKTRQLEIERKHGHQNSALHEVRRLDNAIHRINRYPVNMC